MTTASNRDFNDVDFGRELTALTVGMDGLERRLNAEEGLLDSEGLVPIYLGNDLVPPAELTNWQEAEERLRDLKTRLEVRPEGTRRSFLSSMLVSLEAAAALFQGAHISYGDKLTKLVSVPNHPVDPSILDELRAKLDERLSQSGFKQGVLAERVHRWEAERALPADELPGAFRELMAEAKRRTDTMIFDTGDYDMVLEPVRDVPYTARCNFSEAKMDLNLDQSFPRAALKHLVCHEVYPGHATQLLYTRECAEMGSSPTDVLLCTTNGATGAVQEGIGDQGVFLIDWVEDEDDLVHNALRRLRSASQASAAWHLMESDWDEERMRAYLRDEAFGQPAWVEGRLRFAKHPFRGPFIASYWFGDEAVREVRERAGEAQRDAFVRFLYEHMNTPESLRMFPAHG